MNNVSLKERLYGLLDAAVFIVCFIVLAVGWFNTKEFTFVDFIVLLGILFHYNNAFVKSFVSNISDTVAIQKSLLSNKKADSSKPIKIRR